MSSVNSVATAFDLDSARARFYQNLFSAHASGPKIFSDLEKLNSCYGYDITTIIILFQKYSLSGRIELETKSGQINAVVFQEGQIQFIELSDTDTRIGTLLVNHKLITQQQLEQALKEQTGVPIGAYLVQRGIINKEQIGSLLLTQSRTRLSKLISDEKFLIRIKETETKVKSSELNIEQFYLLVHDWILSKFSPEWLNAHYLEYYNYVVKVDFTAFRPANVQKYSVLSLFNANFLEIIDGQRISDLALLFENNKNFFKALHFLMLLKWIDIDPSEEADNYELKIKHIYKLIMNKAGLDLAYQLSLITKQDANDIELIYEELQKSFLGPESLTNEFKMEIDKKVLNLLINFRTIKNTSSINEINSEKKAAQPKAINVVPIKSLLLAQRYSEALALVKKNKDAFTTVSGLQLYSAWAHLGLSLFKDTQISIGTLEKEVLNILPEDMTTADYHYVNYLLLKAKKQDAPAEVALKRAISADYKIKDYPQIKGLFGWF